ncbi:helix-hairpin-helix domain-containing protein [Pseudomonas sp. IC_126]|uniref:helix-hairpin-helix domain-containing protein n=1 Tax=Pseudomonas sp. IC_126 TaxID=2547400 RepID=UPI0014042B54|nr:helix-hairpin-helix domain-containing protein [Pseudomonas sp. IC_126]
MANVHLLADTLGGPLQYQIAERTVLFWQTFIQCLPLIKRMHVSACADELAKLMFDHYGNEAYEKLRVNPYRLLAFTSFQEADLIALSMGIPMEDPRRLTAAIDAVMYQSQDHGQLGLESSQLQEAVAKLLCIQKHETFAAILRAEKDGQLVRLATEILISEATARQLAFVTYTLTTLVHSYKSSARRRRHISIEDAVLQTLCYKSSWVRGHSAKLRHAFITSLTEALTSQNESFQIIVESPLVEESLLNKSKNLPVSTSTKALFETAPPGRHTVIWLSSSQSLMALARALACASGATRFVLVDDGLAATEKDLVATLLTYSELPSAHLIDPGSSNETKEPHAENLTSCFLESLEPYRSSAPKKPGNFVLRVGSSDFFRALIGLCFQQLKNGPVAVVFANRDDCDFFKARWANDLSQLPAPPFHESLTVTTLDAIESEDVTTMVLPLPLSRFPFPGRPAFRTLKCERFVTVATIDVSSGVPDEINKHISHALLSLSKQLITQAKSRILGSPDGNK